MPIIKEIIETIPGENVIFLNDLDNTDTVTRNDLFNSLVKQYQNDRFHREPACNCGELVGFNNIGVIHEAENCNSPVQHNNQNDSKIWLKTPRGCKTLIKLDGLLQLCGYFVKNNFNFIMYLAYANYRTGSNKRMEYIKQIETLGLTQRGWVYFIDNLEEIILKLFTLSIFIPKPNSNGRWLYSYLIKYGIIKNPITGQYAENQLFTDYVPFPGESVIFLENTPVGAYCDPSIILITDAALNVTGIDLEELQEKRESILAESLFTAVKYHQQYIALNLNGKPRLFRSGVYGFRNPFSGRAVASSINKSHMYDEVHLPWGLGLVLLEAHITSILIKQGYSPKRIKKLILENVHTSTNVEEKKLLESILHDIIHTVTPSDEWIPFTPELKQFSGGIPLIIGRNPSLLKGSIILSRITEIKSDPLDQCIDVSDFCAPPLNLDYDGDALWMLLPTDRELSQSLTNLRLHQNLFLLSEPGKMSGNLAMSKNLAETVASWYNTPTVNTQPKQTSSLWV